ncbi:hypothetical protein CB1_001814011 [Camelus ferus]|nr:hypothetical protein CB1_001814011 [Camelus ferus]
MLKVTVPSCSASSCSSVTASVAPGAGSLIPDYWIDGSNRDALNDFFEVESELGRLGLNLPASDDSKAKTFNSPVTQLSLRCKYNAPGVMWCHCG